jgi:hypothetical protein
VVIKQGTLTPAAVGTVKNEEIEITLNGAMAIRIHSISIQPTSPTPKSGGGISKSEAQINAPSAADVTTMGIGHSGALAHASETLQSSDGSAYSCLWNSANPLLAPVTLRPNAQGEVKLKAASLTTGCAAVKTVQYAINFSRVRRAGR